MKRLLKCPTSVLATLIDAGTLAVFLDANVLIPMYLRAILLDLADAHLFLPFWSHQVIAEMKRNLHLSTGGYRLSKTRTDRIVDAMRSAFPDAMAPDSRQLEPLFSGRTDVKDQHVAASALAISQSVKGGRPVVLVTANSRDLPHWAFEGSTVCATSPDAFLDALFARHGARSRSALEGLCERLKQPPICRQELVMRLLGAGCVKAAIRLAGQWDLALQKSPMGRRAT